MKEKMVFPVKKNKMLGKQNKFVTINMYVLQKCMYSPAFSAVPL